MAVKANKQFWTEFIDTYHSLPSLWNTKDENYNNRESRSMAWNKLVEKLREIEPDVNQGSVKRKINTFRSNFNREVRKMRQAPREQGAELYNPTLWYFDRLSFLLNQENVGMSMEEHYEDETSLMGHISPKCKILQHSEITSESFNQKEDFNNCNNGCEQTVDNKLIRTAIEKFKPITTFANQEGTLLEYTTITNAENDSNTDILSANRVDHPHLLSSIDSESNNLPPKATYKKFKPNRKVMRASLNKRAKLSFKQNPCIRNHLNDNIRSLDEADIYGQSWACGFRKLTPEQKLYAKKAIDEVLILGQLNSLKLHTISMNSS